MADHHVITNSPSMMAMPEAVSSQPIQRLHSDCAQGEGKYTSSAIKRSHNELFLNPNITPSVSLLTPYPQAAFAAVNPRYDLSDVKKMSSWHRSGASKRITLSKPSLRFQVIFGFHFVQW
jgi:hypothetical protein